MALLPDPIMLPDTGQAVSFGSLVGAGLGLLAFGAGWVALRLVSRNLPAKPTTAAKVAGAILGLGLGALFASVTALAALSLISIVFVALPQDFGLFDFATLVAGWSGLCAGIMALIAGKARSLPDTMWISQVAMATLATGWWVWRDPVGSVRCL